MNPLIVIVSNRGPFSFKKNKDGTFDVKRGSGGLEPPWGRWLKNTTYSG